MKCSIRNLVGFGLCVVVALFAASYVQGQDKVRLTGAQLQEQYSKYTVDAVVQKAQKCVYTAVYFGDGKAEYYKKCTWSPGKINKITYRVVEDKICWKCVMTGGERCFQLYRIGEDEYEEWTEGAAGDFALTGIWYKLQ